MTDATSFEDLDLPAELVDALLSEGAEAPTTLQAEAIPLLRRGNPAVLVAGPGAGTLWAWAAPLLARASEAPAPGSILVLAPSAAIADALAEAVGRLAAAVGLRVAGEGPGWVLPELAHLVILSATTAAERLSRSQLDLDTLSAIVIDAGSGSDMLEPVDTVLQAIGSDVQRVMVALPLTDAVRDFADRHLRRAVYIPPRRADGATVDSIRRGALEFIEVGEDRDSAAVLEIAARLETFEHVAVHTRSEDAAADLADRLAIRGIASGRPGEAEVPVWLVLDPLEAHATLRATERSWISISYDLPADEDELDRRHSGVPGVVLAFPRELPHLHAIAQRAGYDVGPAAATAGPRGGIDDTTEALKRALEEDDVDAYLALLEPLFRQYGAARVAAAAVARLRRRVPLPAPAPSTPASGAPSRGGHETGFTRLFVSLGSRDGMRVGDLVGAIVGETGITGDAIGKIELRDTFSRVEISDGEVDRVIAGLNGTSIRGRSVRVDLDRAERGGARHARPPRG
ncbi:MAG: DEAD/DEAH box helicase [Longimicrobiales bacterium]|nr:DEAD/DEAH box helicase [Longimicrobiales bacterium]